MENFGLIKNTFNTILSENIILKDKVKKSLFKGYVKQIKESDILKTQFLIYKNIEDRVDTNESSILEFIKENISLMDKYSKADIKSANLSLFESCTSDVVGDVYDGNNDIKELHENISKLILLNKNASNVGEIVALRDKVADYIKNNNHKVVSESLGVPNSLILSVVSEKYNEKYKDLDETHRRAVKMIIESTDEDKESFFKELVRECIDLVDNSLADANIELKESLLSVKDNLLCRVYVKESFVKDISKMLTLKSDLNV